MDQNPISEKQGIPFAKRAARYSIYAPLASVILNWLSYSVEIRTPQMKLIIGIVIMALYVTGLIMAIIALSGMRKYGKQGILGYALAGLLINGLVVTATIALIPALKQVQKAVLGYSEKELQSMPDVLPDSIKIIDKTLGFRIELPKGFEEFSGNKPYPMTLYSYRKVIDDRTSFVFQIQRLGGTIKQEKLDKKEAIDSLMKTLPAGSRVELIEEKWKAYTLEGFRIEMATGDIEVTGWTVQIPLAKEAIQLNIVSPPQFADEGRMIFKQILKSMIGKSNWDIIGRP